jgi:hypothetical protein
MLCTSQPLPHKVPESRRSGRPCFADVRTAKVRENGQNVRPACVIIKRTDYAGFKSIVSLGHDSSVVALRDTTDVLTPTRDM